ncbi:MAG: hypothetical protein Q8940_12250 [Bacteroidota bacterium]|nr:hypothetical protein [Bacteroidota bacterium]
MKKLFSIFSLIILIGQIIIAQTIPAVDIPLTVKDNAGGSQLLRFGLDPAATDAIDVTLGEQTLPPLPPTGVFDARFVLPNTEATLQDYRQGASDFAGTKVYTIQYQPGTGTQIMICWDLPSGVTGLLQDVITGTVISKQMSGKDTLIVTNMEILKLRMTITYQIPASGPAVNIPLNIRDNAGSKQELRFGLDPAATDAIDVDLGEQILPPLPPSGVFDARFTLPNTEATLKDYRQGSAAYYGTKSYTLQYQPGSGDQIIINWNLPAGVTGSLRDLITGTVINKTMSGKDSLIVTNMEILRLGMTINYQLGVPPAVTANLKVYLQGCFSAGTMLTSLRNLNLIPLSNPYSVSPWNYTGGELLTSVPSQIVDWVLVELRTGTASSTKAARRAGLLRSDGTVVDLDGTSPLSFPGISAGNYYVVIYHRNHLSVMTSQAISLNASSALYDFTTGKDKYYGGDAKDLGSGKFAMYAGDANNDGQITSLDFNVFNPKFYKAVSGYELSDWNMDGNITSLDFNIFNPNFYAGKSTKVPF